jgi:CBS-domain-containing membrane protein
MRRPSIGADVSTYIAFHFAILGSLSWLTGLGFLLPSLGPSIFLFATLPDDEMNFPQRIVGGQFIGAISAIVAFQLLVGHPVAGEPIPPRSLLGLRQVLSTFVAATLTTAGMFVTGWDHPPAYATTLIISLGFINDLTGSIVFFVAVLIAAGTHELFGRRLPIWNLPYQHES